MSSLAALTQAQRAEMACVKPLHLVDVDLGTFVLRWSTRDYVYRYGATRLHYESYLLGLDGLGEQSAFNQASNPKVTLLVANEPWGRYTHLSRLNADVEFQRATVTIYEALLVDEQEVFASEGAGRVIKWRGAVERLRDIDVRNGTFRLDCCSRLFDRRNRVGLSRISTARFPNADKEVVGQWRNLPLGEIEYVPCKLVKTGATDKLFTSIGGTGAVSSIVVSGTSRIPWASSGMLQIDLERFNYSSYNPATKTFSGVSRAQGGTTAAAHSKGATVYQVVTEFVYEASCLPVDSIADVYVDGLRQQIGSNVQVYTGRPGSQLTGYGETAVVRFTAKPAIEKQYNADVSVTQEHSHTTSEGTHGHTFSGAQVVTREGIAHSVGGHVENPAYAHDGDENTAARVVVGSGDASGESFLRIELNNSSNLGTITGILVKVCFSLTVSSYASQNVYYFDIDYGGVRAMRFQPGASLGKGWRSYAVGTAGGWGGYLDFRAVGSASCPVTAYIYEVRVEITCAPKVANAPASGVATARSGSTVVSGSSVAEAVIGREVVVALKGVRDEPACTGGLPAGAVTGTPGALIRRPDHVLKYFLCGLMGIPLADIGPSFDAAGAWYEAAGYRLGFLAQDIGTDAQRLLHELASQCRSILYEWAGRFELVVVPNFAPGACDFTIEPADIVDGPIFSEQPLADTANRIMVMFRKDYRSVRDYGAEVQGPIKAEALDAGFMDYLEDGWGARDLDDTVRLTAIRESAAAQDYLRWYLLRKKLPEVTVSMACTWRATLVTPGMTFYYDDPVQGPGAYLVTDYRQDLEGRRIHIEGLLLPAWDAADCVAHAFATAQTLTQTHLLVAQDCVAAAAADAIHALTVLQAQDAVALAIADEAVIVQTHVLVAQDCEAHGFADNAPLGTAWQWDAQEDLQPADYTGVTGWWEDDAPDLMPRNAVAGSDNFWEPDESGDLMPEAA